MATSTKTSNKLVFKYKESAEKSTYTMPYLALSIPNQALEDICNSIIDIQKGGIKDMSLIETYVLE